MQCAQYVCVCLCVYVWLHGGGHTPSQLNHETSYKILTTFDAHDMPSFLYVSVSYTQQ